MNLRQIKRNKEVKDAFFELIYVQNQFEKVENNPIGDDIDELEAEQEKCLFDIFSILNKYGVETNDENAVFPLIEELIKHFMLEYKEPATRGNAKTNFKNIDSYIAPCLTCGSTRKRIAPKDAPTKIKIDFGQGDEVEYYLYCDKCQEYSAISKSHFS